MPLTYAFLAQRKVPYAPRPPAILGAGALPSAAVFGGRLRRASETRGKRGGTILTSTLRVRQLWTQWVRSSEASETKEKRARPVMERALLYAVSSFACSSVCSSSSPSTFFSGSVIPTTAPSKIGATFTLLYFIIGISFPVSM